MQSTKDLKHHTNYSGKLQCLVPVDMKDLKHHTNYSGKLQCLVPVDMKDLKHQSEKFVGCLRFYAKHCN
jgi:hypothetical protein